MNESIFDYLETQTSISNPFANSNEINLIPSENSLSPLAKLPFLLTDASKYVLDDPRVFGYWAFPGGKTPYVVEKGILQPLIQELAQAKYVNLKPLSGMNCLCVAIAALTEPGDTIYSLPVELGGHFSTGNIIKRLGRSFQILSLDNKNTYNLKKIEDDFKQIPPSLIYIDQANMLKPLTSKPIRNILDKIGLDTTIHFDSSHLNGYYLMNNLTNPLEDGADVFGGSTHKTLPGPHKAFLATNSQELSQKIQSAADDLVSHSHSASLVSLAITLVEMQKFNGKELMSSTTSNAQTFAKEINKSDVIKVSSIDGPETGLTNTHQVWFSLVNPDDSPKLMDELMRNNINVNLLPGLPEVNNKVFRLGFNEFTRLGGKEEASLELGKVFVSLIESPETNVSESVKAVSSVLTRTKYCHSKDNYEEFLSNFSERIDNLE